MWTRFAQQLRCPACRGGLELHTIAGREGRVELQHLEKRRAHGLSHAEMTDAVDTGLLTCAGCRAWFPIVNGVPVMLPYETGTHLEFAREHREVLASLDPPCRPLALPPEAGEQFVMRSFSREWNDYDFDGVLWSWSYEDREAMFLGEIGREATARQPCRFVEIGCGIGLVTEFASQHFPGDAVGVDLSTAAMRAAERYKDHPFLHFVQASLFHLPFAPRDFDLVYSHGVLHHSHSTEKAFRSIVEMCRPGGRTYIWVYGNHGSRESLSRRVAHGVEAVLRPLFARLPAPVNAVLLSPFALLYMGINWSQRKLLGRDRQPYNYRRAMHAVRDRLTPAFAYRHDRQEVEEWFRAAGLENIHHVHEREVPASAHETMRRNVGVRGELLPQTGAGDTAVRAARRASATKSR